MAKRYIFLLTIIAVFTLSLIGIDIHYHLWQIENQITDLAITESGCVEIIYSDEKNFDLVSPISIKDEDGPRTTPKTIAVKNNCSTIKTVEVTMNVLNTSTIDSNKIKVYVNGDYNLEPTLLNTLKELKNTDSDIKEKRLLVKYDLEPNSVNRLNIRMWLDGDATSTTDKYTFYTTYYLTANEQIIKPTLSEKIISDNGGETLIASKGIPDYATAATENEGMYKIGNYYYYRGSVLNNNIIFADMNFKIIGINPDRSLKLIYNDQELLSNYNDISYQENNVSFSDSTVYEFLNNWYNEKLSSYDSYIVNYNYCNDTSSNTYYSKTTYGAYERGFEVIEPSLTCPNTNKNYGGLILSKVGLITMDEAIYAGASKDSNNENYYLYNGGSFFTMSPAYYQQSANIIMINKMGKLDIASLNFSRAIRPVINLNSSLNLKGNGTIESPYELDFED